MTSLEDGRRWVTQGTALFSRALAGLRDEDLDRGCGLPGWTRKHLVAHVSANAEAIGNLVHWAATDIPTPMYASTAQRAADIERGSRLPAAQWRTWFVHSAQALDAAMGGLSADRWQTLVVTAQGRTVPASQTAWMRAREVLIHAVDLDAGVGFADLPDDFLTSLMADIVAKRNSSPAGPAVLVTDGASRWELTGPGDPVEVTGTLPVLSAYLAGRPHADLAHAPGLPPWL